MSRSGLPPFWSPAGPRGAAERENREFNLRGAELAVGVFGVLLRMA